jgi:GTPase SAR1 family protein
MKVGLSTLVKFPNDSPMVTTGVYFPEKGILVTGHENGIVALWDVSKEASFRVLYDCRSKIYTISSSPNGELVVGSHQGEIVVLSLDGRFEVVEPPSYGVKRRIWASVWLNNDSFAVGSTYGEVKLFKRSGKEWTSENLKGHSDSVFGIGGSSSGLITTGDYFGNILVWVPEKNAYKVQQKIKVQSKVYDFSWIGNDTFAAISENGKIYVFEKGLDEEPTWESVYEVKEARSFGKAVHITEDGQAVFGGTTTDVIQFDTEKQLADLIGIGGTQRIFSSKNDVYLLTSFGLYHFKRQPIEVKPDLIKFKYFKIGLVGHTGVGKSTLCNFIVTGSYSELPSTSGRKIWNWEVPKDNGLDRRLILTDYGGQETALSTFLPFLLDSDIILILWQQNDITTFRKALQILHDLKPKIADSVRVFFVQTHIDQKKIPEFNEQILKDLVQKGEMINNLRVSCRSGEGVNELKSSILAEISWDKARIMVQSVSADAVLQTIMRLQDTNVTVLTPKEFFERFKIQTKLPIEKTHLKFLLRDYSNQGIIEYNPRILDLIIFNHPEYNQLKTDIPIYMMKQNGIIRNENLVREFKNSRFLPVICSMYLKYRIAIENFGQIIFPRLLPEKIKDIPEPYLGRLKTVATEIVFLQDVDIDTETLLRALSELNLQCICASKLSGVFAYEENAIVYYNFEKSDDPFVKPHIKCHFRIGGKEKAIYERLGRDFLRIVDGLFGPFLEMTKSDDKKKVDTGRIAVHDVAISYASEQREYARRVADILRAKGVRVFFDPFFETKMWGKELPEYLMNVYYKESRYCMIFISKDYVSKAWPTFELKCAIARSVESMGDYILPIRFDNSEVPGLSPTISYINANEKTPEDIAKMFMEKLKN